MVLLKTDVLIVGGGTGGCAAAMALVNLGFRVVMTEPTPWIGGQLTSQAVPPDEHFWIETCGSSHRYRAYRERVREVYRRTHALTSDAKSNLRLNPGGGWVSRVCHDPVIGHQVLNGMLDSDLLDIRLNTVPLRAEVKTDRIVAVEFRQADEEFRVEAAIVLDATETGDLLPLAQAEYRLGAESRAEFDEPNGLDRHETDCVQGITWCAAIGWDPEGDYTIPKPVQYDRWRAHVPANWTGGNLLSFEYPNVQTGVTTTLPLWADKGKLGLFSYRQIVEPNHYRDGQRPEAATIMNWPQNDMWEGTILDVSAEVAAQRLEDARQLTLSVLYWLQTEHGQKGLRLRPDLTGTSDGLAMAPYIRESRRAVTMKTIREQDVAAAAFPGQPRAPKLSDGIAVGAYRLDLHPRANGRPTLDIGAVPYQIPLGALIPVRMQNLIPACKNFGVTHIANGCTRLHPIEWCVGEAAGCLAAWSIRSGRAVQEAVTSEVQSLAQSQGIETDWPELRSM